MVLKSKGALKAQSSAKSDEPEVTVPTKPKKSSSSTNPRSKSPARARTTSRTRSPNRTRSPARKSPSRAKPDVSPSPLQSSTPKVPVIVARSPIGKSPKRKSPTRAVVKSSEPAFTERVQRPRRPQSYADTDSDDFDVDIPPLSEKPQAAVRGRARRLEVQVEKLSARNVEPVVNTFEVIKRITRNSQNREVERIVHLKNFDKVTKKLGDFSDEDDIIPVRKSESIERTSDFKQVEEFGGTWGALFFILAFPLSTIALNILCGESRCSFYQIPDFRKYRLLPTYFDLISALGFTSFVGVLALFTAIPFGGRKVAGVAMNQSKFIYTMNGLSSFVIMGVIAGALEARGIRVADFITKHVFHMLVVSILFATFLSIYAYVRSFYVPFSSVNIHVVGRKAIYGFFMGREINPRLFGILDWKIFLYRYMLIGSLFLDYSYVYKGIFGTSNIQSPGDPKTFNLNPALLVFGVIRSIYFLDFLTFEASTVTNFDIQYEGFGYMAIFAAVIYPFLTSVITRYIVSYNVQLAIWKLVLISIVFIFGYILCRGSNSQKDAFRKNPYDPALSHLETIPTTKGKKLICSGFWGVVRHPNYLGDIIMNLTFIPFFSLTPPILVIVATLLFLTHRALRDNVRCKQKYGAAWDRYCNKVKYILVPKIF